jgi:hypothetical protein
MPAREVFRSGCASVKTLPIGRSSSRLGEATADQCLGFARQDSQRIPRGIGSDVAQQRGQHGCGNGLGTSNGLARD